MITSTNPTLIIRYISDIYNKEGEATIVIAIVDIGWHGLDIQWFTALPFFVD